MTEQSRCRHRFCRPASGFAAREALAAFANTPSRPRHCCFEHPRVCGGGDGRRWTTARLWAPMPVWVRTLSLCV